MALNGCARLHDAQGRWSRFRMLLTTGRLQVICRKWYLLVCGAVHRGQGGAVAGPELRQARLEALHKLTYSAA